MQGLKNQSKPAGFQENRPASGIAGLPKTGRLKFKNLAFKKM
jgi:hypothetical protein